MSDADEALAQAEARVRAGEFDAALAEADALLRADPAQSRALVVRVNAANALGRLDLVIDSLQRLLRLHPMHAQFTRMLASAIVNRGGAARQRGDPAAAATDFATAIELQPAHPQAWFNFALCLRDMGRSDAASEVLQRHLELVPDDRDARRLLATLQGSTAAGAFLDRLDPATGAGVDAGWFAHTAVRAGRIDAAVAAFERLTPADDLAAALETVTELRLRGEPDAAISAAGRLIGAARAASTPTLRAELIEALALPAVYAEDADLQRWRARYLDGLARLESRWTAAHLTAPQAPLRQLSHSNFLLAYQGHDDVDPQRRFAALLERAAAHIAPALQQPPRAARSGRIGLLSSCWRSSTVGSYFSCWIDWLRDAGFAVHVYQLGPQRDAYTDELGARATVFRYFETALEDVARRVRDDDLDLLIYPELGMDARLSPLATLQLARRQAVAWGHPVTSGFARIDNYLTCAAMEPAGAAAHYVERLQPLPGLGVDYRLPPRPAPRAPAALGLDPARTRVLVPQSVFKLHPDGDAVMAAIAAARRDVQFVLFEAEHPRWWQRYRARLQRAFDAVGCDLDAHLSLQPLGSRERFLQLNAACDVMLDSLHWSGGNTAIDALFSALPVVTCAGALMRGRQSHAMLQRLGMAEELSVATPQAQAARVVELLAQPELRRALSQRIAERLPDLFEADAARAALVQWARSAVEG